MLMKKINVGMIVFLLISKLQSKIIIYIFQDR